MATKIKLPELGENIESADVISVLVKKGDTIEEEQSLIEIETDKATIEVPSTLSGKVVDVMVKEGDNIKVGQAIIKVDENGSTETEDVVEEKTKKEDTKDEKTGTEEKKNKTTKKEETRKEETKPQPASGKGEIAEFKVPDLGENIESADVINVLISKGDIITKDQGVIEIETDKATIEVPSTLQGKILEVNVKTGDTVKVGDVLFKAELTSEVPESTAKDRSAKETRQRKAETSTESPKGEVATMRPGERDDQPPITKGSAPAAPSVRRIAREIGVDINEVKGTGPGGRISMDDVKAHSKKLHETRKSGVGTGIKAEPLPDFRKHGEVERKKMSKIRKVTADHLSYAWATIPHVTQFDKANITEFERERKELSPQIEKQGGKLTATAILIKIIAEGMEKFPQFNSSIDMEKKEIIYKKYYNIGVAVDTENGLLVPVIKNVDKKNLAEISAELGVLAQKARDKKLSLEDMQGGCFTITNLGGIGGTYFTPVVNSPEVAILGVSRSKYEPVYDGKENFKPALMLPLSLSYDHRIIDGADAIRFLRWVCEILEQPLRLLL
ncbi:dihydrolipoyllysine-residue acetyltransferase [bacterium BMS3Abin03]|jgi:pyruvate dehydrogenase E2 component (dihydrolipoamide acetyltransferase)|nr:dihydrolipoyllysine-residue acetyltransferase [bacterium BMS3Abin03]